MHRGEVGTINLNQILQEGLNPNSGIPMVKGIPFNSGDKVMQLKNNYQKEIFNGDIGRVTSVQAGEEMLLVDYFGRSVSYDFSELNELTLAYAITVHKSQGSEYPVIIVPIMGQHFALLNRSLLYTALTRGKKLVVLIGTSRALEIALKNNQPQKRMTNLSVRLVN
jgi:exodeoxyribonuclease V alpha subunit